MRYWYKEGLVCALGKVEGIVGECFAIIGGGPLGPRRGSIFVAINGVRPVGITRSLV